MQQTFDGGYIIFGRTDSYGAGESDAFLIKTDAIGDTIWTRTYGGNNIDSPANVQQTTDGGYILCGTTYSHTVGLSDIFLIKTDASGYIIWVRTFGGSDFDKGYSVQQTTDSGYILVGSTRSYGAGSTDVYLIKTDAVGDTLWTRTYGGIDWDEGLCVRKTAEGGYIITGKTGSYGAGESDVYLIKTDAQGDTVWTRVFGNIYRDYGSAIEQTMDGGYIIAGNNYTWGPPREDVYLIKTDANGDSSWTKTYGGVESDEYGGCVKQTLDGGYIIGGSIYIYSPYGGDLYLIKTDERGDTVWTRTYDSGGLDDGGTDIYLTRDSGFIAAGTARTFADFSDIWVLRFEGEHPAVFMNPVAPPIVIPQGGGSFLFNVLLDNSTPNPFTIDVWTEAVLPAGRLMTPILYRSSISIAARAVVSRQLNQFVPAYAPSGNYIYRGNVGTYPDSVVASDSFPFEKLGTDNDGRLGSPSDWPCYGWFDDDEASAIQPSEFTLHPSYPNPFNPAAALSFDLPKACEVRLTVYDIAGREAARLAEGLYPAGRHSMLFDASGMASGVYFARLQAGDFRQTLKLLLVK